MTSFLRAICLRMYLFLMSRIQSEPQRHSTPLAFSHSPDTVRVLFSRAKANHTAALWTHLGLKSQHNLHIRP